MLLAEIERFNQICSSACLSFNSNLIKQILKGFIYNFTLIKQILRVFVYKSSNIDQNPNNLFGIRLGLE